MYTARKIGWITAATLCGHQGLALSEPQDAPVLDGRLPDAVSIAFEDKAGCGLLAAQEGCMGDVKTGMLTFPYNFRLFYKEFSETVSHNFFDKKLSNTYGSLAAQANWEGTANGKLVGISKAFTFGKCEIFGITLCDTGTGYLSLDLGHIYVDGKVSANGEGRINAGTYQIGNLNLTSNLIPSSGGSSQTFSWPSSSLSFGGCTLQYSSGKLTTPAVEYKNGTVSYSASSLSALNASLSGCNFATKIDGHTVSVSIPGVAVTARPVNIVGAHSNITQYTIPLDLTLPAASFERSYTVSGSAKSIFGQFQTAVDFDKNIGQRAILASNTCLHADSDVWAAETIGIVFGPSLKGSAGNPSACDGHPFIAKRGWAITAAVTAKDTFYSFAGIEEKHEAAELAAQVNAYVAAERTVAQAYLTKGVTLLQNALGKLNDAALQAGKHVPSNAGGALSGNSIPAVRQVTGNKILNVLGLQNSVGTKISAMVGVSDTVGRCALSFGISDGAYGTRLNGFVACSL